MRTYSADALGRLIRVAIRALLAYPFHTAWMVFIILVAQGAVTLVPIAMKNLVEALEATTSLASVDLPAFFVAFVLPIITLRCICWMFWRISGFIASSLQPQIRRDLTLQAYDAVMAQSYSFYTNTFVGSLVKQVRSLPDSAIDFLENIWWAILPLVISFVGSVFILSNKNTILGLVTCLWMLIIIGLQYGISKYKLPLDAIRSAKGSAVMGGLADAITNSTNIKLFTTVEPERKRFRALIEEWRTLQLRSWRIGESGAVLQNLAAIFFELVAMGYSLHFWKTGVLSIGDLVLIQATLVILFNVSYDLGRIIRRLYETSAEALEMMDILKLVPSVLDKKRAKALKVTKGTIEFKNVDFSYNDGREVIQKLNLSIGAREKVAFVGQSGAGKSTITKLLLRFYDIQNGKITIDKQDIADVTQESLREAVALVPQDPVLFHRSLKENIGYGRRDATDEEIIEAAKKAQCHEFISSLAHGYDTLVGERGVKLSGGERQRVAIARAILKNAPILLLDEATSSLDSESESLIQKALHELMKEKTVIVIAHRLSTIMEMDRIIVMENGTVIDTGTHDELLKKMGVYQKLWSIQAGGFVNG